MTDSEKTDLEITIKHSLNIGRLQAFKEALEIAKDYDRWCICHNKCSDIEGCSKNLADEIQEKINELEGGQ